MEKEGEKKKENSYTYWVDKDKENGFYKNGDKSTTIPQLLTDPSQLTNTKVGSAWNIQGTFEHKVLSAEDLAKFLNKELIGCKIGDLEVSAFKDVKGEISCLQSRGKQKPGYDLTMKVLQEKGDKTCGVTYKELIDYEADPEVVIDNGPLKTIIKGKQAQIHEMVVKYVREYCFKNCVKNQGF